MPGLTSPDSNPNRPICTDADARTAGLDTAPTPAELAATAETVVTARGHDHLPEVDLARAVPLMCAEIRRLRIELAVCQSKQTRRA